MDADRESAVDKRRELDRVGVAAIATTSTKASFIGRRSAATGSRRSVDRSRWTVHSEDVPMMSPAIADRR
jgi:hypothetical protein